MAHILFVDSNLPGIQTLGRAKALGHHVTLLRGTEYTMYADTPATRSVLASLDHVVEMGVTSNVQQVLDVALDLARKTPFDAIVTQHDYPSESAAAVAEALKLPFMSLQAVRNARCKEEARRLLDAMGIPSARWALANSVTEALRATEEIGLPVVVKPSSGSDSILAARCDTLQQVAAAVESIFDGRKKLPRQMREQLSRGILVEEHLGGPLVSAEIALHQGKIIRYMISGRVRAISDETIELGAAMPASIPDDVRESCFEYAEAVVRALSLDFGFAHLEMIITPRGPILVEANPRLMGGIMPRLYEKVTGHNILDDLLALHLGHSRTEPPSPRRFATTRKVMLAQEGTLSDRCSPAEIAAITSDMDVFDAPGILPGARVARHGIVGRLVASAPSMEAADARANKALRDLSKLLGVPLVQ